MPSKKTDKKVAARDSSGAVITIPSLNDEVLEVTVVGTCPLIINAFPEKAKQQLKDKDAQEGAPQTRPRGRVSGCPLSDSRRRR